MIDKMKKFFESFRRGYAWKLLAVLILGWCLLAHYEGGGVVIS